MELKSIGLVSRAAAPRTDGSLLSSRPLSLTDSSLWLGESGSEILRYLAASNAPASPHCSGHSRILVFGPQEFCCVGRYRRIVATRSWFMSPAPRSRAAPGFDGLFGAV